MRNIPKLLIGLLNRREISVLNEPFPAYRALTGRSVENADHTANRTQSKGQVNHSIYVQFLYRRANSSTILTVRQLFKFFTASAL